MPDEFSKQSLNDAIKRICHYFDFPFTGKIEMNTCDKIIKRRDFAVQLYTIVSTGILIPESSFLST